MPDKKISKKKAKKLKAISANKRISEILEANRMLGVEKDWNQKMSFKLKEIAGYKDNADGADV